jgi:hypothetical protein
MSDIYIVRLKLDEKHRDALQEIMEMVQQTFSFDGRDDDGAAEEVVEDVLEAIKK